MVESHPTGSICVWSRLCLNRWIFYINIVLFFQRKPTMFLIFWSIFNSLISRGVSRWLLRSAGQNRSAWSWQLRNHHSFCPVLAISASSSVSRLRSFSVCLRSLAWPLWVLLKLRPYPLHCLWIWLGPFLSRKFPAYSATDISYSQFVWTKNIYQFNGRMQLKLFQISIFHSLSNSTSYNYSLGTSILEKWFVSQL